MKKLDFTQTVGLLANLGVIAGIVFLGLELRQNNELSLAEARRARSFSLEETYRMVSENGDLAELIIRDRANEPLTNVEQFRVRTFWLRSLTSRELAYSELDDDGRSVLLVRLRDNWRTSPALRQAWADNQAEFEPDFAQWIRENVATGH